MLIPLDESIAECQYPWPRQRNIYVHERFLRTYGYASNFPKNHRQNIRGHKLEICIPGRYPGNYKGIIV